MTTIHNDWSFINCVKKLNNKVIVAANRVYHEFLASEDGSGFSGQVNDPFYPTQVNLGSHILVTLALCFKLIILVFLLPFYRTQVSWSDLCVWLSLSETPSENLTDLTLADEETNSILTDKVNRTIQCNVAMKV